MNVEIYKIKYQRKEAIGLKWIYKIKYNEDGTTLKHNSKRIISTALDRFLGNFCSYCAHGDNSIGSYFSNPMGLASI